MCMVDCMMCVVGGGGGGGGGGIISHAGSHLDALLQILEAESASISVSIF